MCVPRLVGRRSGPRRTQRGASDGDCPAWMTSGQVLHPLASADHRDERDPALLEHEHFSSRERPPRELSQLEIGRGQRHGRDHRGRGQSGGHEHSNAKAWLQHKTMGWNYMSRPKCTCTVAWLLAQPTTGWWLVVGGCRLSVVGNTHPHPSVYLGGQPQGIWICAEVAYPPTTNHKPQTTTGSTRCAPPDLLAAPWGRPPYSRKRWRTRQHSRAGH
jgi:hypothetical protein